MAESEMIERVAREIYEKAYGDGGWAEVEDSVRLSFLGQARAAIEAMRDPPARVLDAMNPSGRYAGIVVPEAWNDAIDAALSPSTKD